MASEQSGTTIRRLIAEATVLAGGEHQCAVLGHDWQHTGGANAGCGPDCCCSVPVRECRACGDCDYGDNADADDIRRDCEQEREWRGEMEVSGA